jgi:hypothetical protein
MTKKCAACGALNPAIAIGGTLLCADCAPAIREEIDKLREAGKPVDASRIAYRHLQSQSGNLMIRNVPETLLQRIGHAAVDQKTSKRAVVIAALERGLE